MALLLRFEQTNTAFSRSTLHITILNTSATSIAKVLVYRFTDFEVLYLLHSDYGREPRIVHKRAY